MKYTKCYQLHKSNGNNYSSEKLQKKNTKVHDQDPTTNQDHQNSLLLNIQENLKQANILEI